MANRFTWEFREDRLREEMDSSDDWSDYRGWPIVTECLYSGITPDVLEELAALIARDDWERWEPHVDMASGTSIRQAYMLAMWEDWSGRQVQELEHIGEVGAGLGDMYILCRRLGFTGKYSIFDLPEVTRLRNWIIEQANLGAPSLTANEVSTWATAGPFDLAIGLCSLSEMPMAVRHGCIQAVSKGWMLRYQRIYDDVDNDVFFRTHFPHGDLSDAYYPGHRILLSFG